MTALLAVAAGGAVGAVARWLVTGSLDRWLGAAFPFGTLAVNVLGSAAMGVLVGAAAHAWSPSPELRAALAAGVLGAFTTFSAFALDVVVLAERGAWLAACGYVAASVVLSIVGLVGGLYAVRWLLA